MFISDYERFSRLTRLDNILDKNKIFSQNCDLFAFPPFPSLLKNVEKIEFIIVTHIVQL